MSDEYRPTAEEQEWIARELVRDPRLTEQALTSLLKTRHGRAADDERLALRAHEIGSTVSALRQAEVEAKAERLEAGRVEALRRARAATGSPQSGPQPMTTIPEVERARRDLQAEGVWAGERSIARKLGVSRDAVRYALGKDRRQR